MIILNFIEKIYENSNFLNMLIIGIILLFAIFGIILFLGIRDLKKSKEPKEQIDVEPVDITFDKNEINESSEDVTFEMPVLTKNLADFKRNLVQEIESDKINEDVEVVIETESNNENKDVPVKILDINDIEDTAIVPVLEETEKSEVAFEENGETNKI